MSQPKDDLGRGTPPDAGDGDAREKKRGKARIALSETEEFGNMSALRRTLILLWENLAVILVALALLCAVLMTNTYRESLRSASMVLSLNFEQSAQGCYPNGTRLNMNDLKSSAVLEETRALAGITDQISTRALSNSISIVPTVARRSSTSSSTFYFATSYRVTLTLPKRLQYVSAEDVLELLCAAYARQFYTERIESSTILTQQVSYEDEEFYVITDLLEARAEQLRRFLTERSSRKITEANNAYIVDFKRQLNAVDNFIAQNIEKLRAYLLQYGVARAPEDYEEALTYKTLLSSTAYKKDMAAYQANTAGLAMYDPNMSAAVLIPVQTGSDHYMSRTKSEMDYATERASAALSTANEIYQEIEFNERVLAKLKDAQYGQAVLDHAKALLADAIDYLNALSKEIYQTNRTYFFSQTANYLTCQFGSASFSERVALNRTALSAAAAGAIFALLVYLSQATRRHSRLKRAGKGGARA